MQTIPNQRLSIQSVKAYNVPYITPTDRIIEPNTITVENPIVLNSVTVTNYPPIIQRNESVENYNKSLQLNTVDQNYNIINPSTINPRNSYTFYDKTNNLLDPNIYGQKFFQTQTYINPVVNNISYDNNNVIRSIKTPTYVNNVNNISLVPNYTTTVRPLSRNSIRINPNLITSVNQPKIINKMQSINLNGNPTIIQNVNAHTITSGINPSQNIITTVPVPVPTLKPHQSIIYNNTSYSSNIGSVISNPNLISTTSIPTLVNPRNSLNTSIRSSSYSSLIPSQRIISNAKTPYYINSNNALYNIDINGFYSHNYYRNQSSLLMEKKPKVYNQKINYIRQSINSPIDPGENFNLSEFRIVSEIGKGSFGKIYKVLWISNNKFYALKKEILRDIERVKERQHRNQTIRNFIRMTNCQGVVNIYGNYCVQKGVEFHNFELMELCERDFAHEIKARAQFQRFYTETELYNVMFQLISTLSFLQKSHITHRDIKPQNILISNGIYKLCDFGDIRLMEREGIVIQRVRGSELYMSPILFNGLRARVIHVRHNTYKSDVFSLGMCFLLAACLSFDCLVQIRELSDMTQIQMILYKYLSARYSQKCINILLLMLQTEEFNRPDFISLESAIKVYGF